MQTSVLDRARKYINAMPCSVAGSGGHNAAFNVAVVLVQGFALQEADAFQIFVEWNQTHASPPWSEAELRQKLRSAAKTSTRPLGYLLNDTVPTPSQRFAPDFESEGEKKVRQRKEWPAFKALKSSGLQTITDLRNLPIAAVDLAHKCGLLAGAQIEGHRCFIIHEGTFAQARRLDGKPFTRFDGTSIKAKNLPGSQGAFIGRQLLGVLPPIMLVEGCIGWLEAIAAILMADHTDWTALAAVSAYSRFENDPALLLALSNRRVRIIPDNDPKGQGFKAAAIWTAELRAVGAIVDAYALPAGVKDIGDIITAPERHAETLDEIFTL